MAGIGKRVQLFPEVLPSLVGVLVQVKAGQRHRVTQLVLALEYVLLRLGGRGRRDLLVRQSVRRAALLVGLRKVRGDVSRDSADAIGRDHVAGEGVANVTRSGRTRPRGPRIVNSDQAAV